MTEPSSQSNLTLRRVVGAAGLLAGSVLLSRLLGLVREMVLAFRAGAGTATDAYNGAFLVPDILNYLLAGGSFSIAFIPLYARYLEGSRDREARHFLATVFGTMGGFAILAAAALWWWAEPLVDLLFQGFDAETREHTVRLARILLPSQVFFISGGILRAALMARGRFGAQAMAPLFYNAGIILGGWFFAPQLGVEAFAWGALVGSFVGPFLISAIQVQRLGILSARFAPFDPAFRSYLALALPLMLGVTLLTVDVWYDKLIGNYFGVATVSYLGYARKLMDGPVGIVGQAIAAASLPAMTRLWTAGRSEELARLTTGALQAGVALAVLAAGVFFFLPEPWVRVAFERGAFAAADTAQVSAILAVLVLGIPGAVAAQIAVRGFYARRQPWLPALMGTAIALATVPLYLELGRRMGGVGLATASAIGQTANAAALLAMARYRYGTPALGALGQTTLRALSIAAAAGVAALLILQSGPGMTLALRNLALAGGAFAGVALLGVTLFGDAAMKGAVARLLKGFSVGGGRRDT